MAEQQLTRRAQDALRRARQESAHLGHGYVGSEHLLLALCREYGCAGQRILTGAGLEGGTGGEHHHPAGGVGAHGCPPCQGLTPDCYRCIELAARGGPGPGKPLCGDRAPAAGSAAEQNCMAARVLLASGLMRENSIGRRWPPWGRLLLHPPSGPNPGRVNPSGTAGSWTSFPGI